MSKNILTIDNLSKSYYTKEKEMEEPFHGAAV